jgi:hypothetical protein
MSFDPVSIRAISSPLARVCHSPWNEKRKKARLVVAMAYLHRLAVGKSRRPMALGRKARSVAARLVTP